MYVGTYTVGQASKGIYRVQLNTLTGTLSDPVVAAEAINPSFLALDSSSKHLYAVDESDKGQVSAYIVEPDKGLTKLGTQETLGSYPCHLSVGPGDKCVMVANYGNGTISRFVVRKDGSLDPAASKFQNVGKGPNTSRQEGPHMHMIAVVASGRFALTCDLGTDEVLVFPFDMKSGEPVLVNPTRVKTPAGAGPRHWVLDRKSAHLYVNNELQNSVSVFAFDPRKGPGAEIQNIPTLPVGFDSKPSTTAEIALHPNGRWLYVSNRGHDSIACYRVGSDGKLALIDILKLSIHEPRGFAIDPSGKWLVVGGQHSNNLASLEIDQMTGGLKAEKSIVHLPAPVCVLFPKP